MNEPYVNAGTPMNNPSQEYGQPVANAVPSNGMPTTIVVNQQSANGMINPNLFKTTSNTITCTFCHKTVNTTVVKKCKCCACCLCWVTGICIYLCIQACRGKDLCWYDARHTCPSCGNVVGNYNAC